MTPQERDLVTALLERLKRTPAQPKDPEAEQLIRQAMAEQPDAPYLLVQTVLMQDLALHQAQARITELERQCAEARAGQGKPAEQPTSFLGGLFGRGGQTGAPAGSGPAPGPWSRPAAPPQAAPPQQAQQGGPQYAPQQPYSQQPYGQGGMFGGGGGGGGFLRQAAATAAGVAGGALLFEGIQSMFGQHAGGMLSGASMQPGISETVVNNYYENDPAANAPQNAAWDQPAGTDQGADYASSDDQAYVQDADYAPDTDVASDMDFGDGDDYA
jgi:hypothetical protein